MFDKERLLPKPYKAHELWSLYYDNVVNQDSEESARINLERIRREADLTPELEQLLRNGEYGVRLKGILLMAFRQVGQEITREEKMFIFDNFDQIKGGPPFQS